MMETAGRGDVAMNLVGLILIAALSGGIVAVSLRLRASASSDGMWIDSNRLPEEEVQLKPEVTHGRGGGWLQDKFGLKGDSRLYRAGDQVRS